MPSRSSLACLALAAVAVGVAACGGATTTPTAASTSVATALPSTPVRTVSATRSGPRPAVVSVRTAPGYGRLLVDIAGRTLYLFTADHGATSACSGACAVAWPPLLAHGPPGAVRGVRGARLGVIRRSGGQTQLTYHGHPLYYYVGDRKPGQINCQNAEEYGGHWWLVKPDGNQNRATP